MTVPFSRSDDHPSIFLGLGEVSGFYKNLRRGFERLSVPVHFINLFDHVYEYEGDDTCDVAVARLLKKVLARYGNIENDGPDSLSVTVRKQFWKGVARILQVLLLAWAAARHEVFILSAHSNFFSPLGIYDIGSCRRMDLRILSLLGKRVIQVYHGGDSSAPYLDVRPYLETPDFEQIAALALRKKEVVATVEEYADVVVSTPVRGHFHEQPFVSQLGLGLPVELDVPSEYETGSQEERRSDASPVRILHAPSHQLGKGTVFIRQTVETLRERGHEIEFRCIHDVPHREVVAALAWCDLVVDQVFTYSVMAGLASEAAYMGKPTVAAGYYAHRYQKDYPKEEMIPPVEFCRPSQLTDAVEKLVTDEGYRRELGREAQQFVRKRWSPSAVAGRFLRIARDSSPSEWTFDPSETRYVHGWGLREEQLSRLLARYVDSVGPSALCVDDKPELRDRLLELARRGKEHITANRGRNGISTDLLARARDALTANDPEEAARLVQTCLQSNPKDVRAYVVQAHLAAVRGRPQQVERIMNRIAILDPHLLTKYRSRLETCREKAKIARCEATESRASSSRSNGTASSSARTERVSSTSTAFDKKTPESR